MRLKPYFAVLACAVIATLTLDGCAANNDTVNDVVEWETAREQGRLAIAEARFDDAAAAYRRAFELAGATDFRCCFRFHVDRVPVDCKIREPFHRNRTIPRPG